MQTKLSKLKTILQKNDTKQGFEQFVQILKNQTQSFSTQDLSLLLRWAVLNQNKQFSAYYKLLSELGANVNFVDTRQYKSNLMIACQSKREDIVQTIAQDKNVNFLLQDTRHKTALSYAINNKNKASGEKFVRILLSKCPKLLQQKSNNNPLLQAITFNKVQIVKALLSSGLDPNISLDQNDNTALHQIFRILKINKNKSVTNVLQILQLLIQKNANPYKENKLGKNAFQKNGEQFKEIYQEIKKKCQKNSVKQDKNGQKVQPTKQQQIIPILTINTTDQRQAIYQSAAQIYKKHQATFQKIEPKTKTSITYIPKPTIQYQQQSQQQGYDDDPFQPTHLFINQLTSQINSFTQQCLVEYQNARKDLQDFLTCLTPIVQQLGFRIEIYGSYATGLWINQCDIDILLIPNQAIPINQISSYLELINKKLKSTPYQRVSILRNIKIPLMRIQFGQQRDLRRSRKFDISILTPNNNGLQHKDYILQYLHIFPQIKPLFYVLKKLTHCYRMYDPLRAGIRSFALFLLLLFFFQEPHNQNLGQLLIKFLYKYGYGYDYIDQYVENGNKNMVLNLYDPYNEKNNIGKNTDAFALQKMFKTAYLVLHTRDVRNKLHYMFQSKDMFCWAQDYNWYNYNININANMNMNI